MVTKIYFFSGTGNTLFLVKELKQRIPESILVPIASLRDEKVVVPGSKKIGFCFPNHGGTVPAAMKMFIKKLCLNGDEYLFTLVSSGGTGCNAFEVINRIVRKSGVKLSGEFLINVPSFNPKTDDMSTYPLLTDLEEFKNSVPEKLDRIAKAVRENTNLTEMDAPPCQLPWYAEKLAPLLLDIFVRFPSLLKNYFYVESNCNGCATCEIVCQTGRIMMINGRPQWDPKILCYNCHACLGYCPTGAIQVTKKMIWAGSKTKENPRFKPPFASVIDISRQKNEREYPC